MQVAVQPVVGQGQQAVEGIAESRGAGRHAIARVGAGQRGGEVGDRHRGAVERLAQGGLQPLLTGQPLFAHLLGHEGSAMAAHLGLFQIEVRRPERLGAFFQRVAYRVAVGGQRVEIGPERGADQARAADDERFAFQPVDVQRAAQFAQAVVRFVEVQVVVFVVARNVHHRRGPAVARRVAAQPEVRSIQPGPPAVRADVPGQHQQVRAGRGPGQEGGIGFEMQVGEQLDLHTLNLRRPRPGPRKRSPAFP
ncbi:hypothetical protein D9M72_255120 [compost metagenome]